ncbi:hypothetical protein AB0J38_40255 [Streptomyces sp. NPDC050095]|uniref:hypothetical protein n=1 Tax=unclassified Streptomyces TaxID=2593676 RepID=UPI00344AD01F
MRDSTEESGADRPGREQRRTRIVGWFGLGLTLIGAVLFALVPPAEADNRAYAAAADCPAGTRSDSCRAAVEVTVADKDTSSSGKSIKYLLYLHEPGTPKDAERKVRLPDESPVYDAVRRGDQITAVYWKDEIRQVRFGDVTQDVKLSPAQDGRLPGAFAVALVPIGLGLLWLWWWMRYRPVPKGAPRPWQPVVGLVAGIFAAVPGFLITLLAVDHVGSGLKFSAGCVVAAVPPAVLLCWWAGRRSRQVAAGVVPQPPDGRRVLPWVVVHGDVPYSKPGFSYLVVGDGPLAATTDPAGRVALAPLPASLTVLRVREPVVGDPPYDLGGRGEYTVVVECRDGDETVLVFVAQKSAPRALGALLAASGTPVSDYRPSV